MDDKDGKPPFLCMLINPEFDAAGKLTGAQVMGDFLDTRAPYAPPYPSHTGTSTSVNNPEYPGKENVLVGPILNGYDLSSWAQVPTGSMRFVFVYRPKNTVPYFQLEEHLRDDVLVDTTLQLTPTEVYTLHLLQKDFDTKEIGLLLRTENFHKQPFSDSLVYVNFYNYSADGFADADARLKPDYAPFRHGIKDRMNVFLTLYPDEEAALANLSYQSSAVPGYKGKYLTSIEQNVSSGAAMPYLSFPLWANPEDDGIRTKSWQHFDFFAPGISPTNNPYAFNRNAEWESFACIFNGSTRPGDSRNVATALPNLLVNIHSGKHNPRSFATVNTIEVVNGFVYLTTIQRKYPAPEY